MTPVDGLLVGLLVALALFHYLTDRRWTAERTRLINEILSKTASEFHQRQIAAGQDEPKRPKRPRPQGDPAAPPLPIGL